MVQLVGPSSRYGMRFTPGQSSALANVFQRLVKDPERLFMCAQRSAVGSLKFDVLTSVRQLEKLFIQRRAVS